MRHLLVLTGLFVLACTSISRNAHRTLAGTTASARDEAQFANDLKLLKDVLAPRVNTLDRQLLTFHYEQDAFRADSLAAAQERVRGWTENYFDLSKAGYYEQGPGEYTAVDTVRSRSFGGTDPKLFVIPIRAGARVLDLVPRGTPGERATIYRLAFAYGCGDASMSVEKDIDDMLGNVRRSVKDMFGTPLPFCQRFMTQALADLGVQIIMFPYPPPIALKGCRFERGQAFDVVRNDAIDFTALEYYDNAHSFNARSASFLPSFYREASLDYSYPGVLQADAPVRSSRGTPAEETAYGRWKNLNIYGCGEVSSIERIDPDREQVRSEYYDRSLKIEQDKFTRAYLKKTRQSDVNILRLRGVEDLLYAADPPDHLSRADFAKAVDGVFRRQYKGSLQDVARLLAVPNPESTDSTLGQVYEKASRFSGKTRLPQAYRALKFEGRLLRLALTRHLSDLSAAPLVRGDPFDPTAWTESAKAYRNILRVCTAMYRDPRRTLAEIEATPCAVRH